ncbi:hypothetical protein DRJ48_04865 [Candidatus Woesearchaeota archaeon]|nr:hypothetical protein [Candidatus Woesearchaeota archaeon]RLE41798.1 MAG: hypothetical protein DRJ48_04865 [Candidatus Woesearchaeota archaeon]
MSHYETLINSINGYAITKHFKRDLGLAKATAVALDILDSNHTGFEELHKFEEKVEGCHIFRAKIDGIHIVYAVTPEHKLVFLRGFKNFKEYEKFLSNKKKLKEMLSNH